MRRDFAATLGLLLTAFGCVPAAKKACITSGDCSRGHTCVLGTCRTGGMDAAWEQEDSPRRGNAHETADGSAALAADATWPADAWNGDAPLQPSFPAQDGALLDAPAILSPDGNREASSTSSHRDGRGRDLLSEDVGVDLSRDTAPPDAPIDPSPDGPPDVLTEADVLAHRERCENDDDCNPPQVCNINTDGRCGKPSYTQIDVAGDNTCAVVSDGTLRCWGHNTHGQLGPDVDAYYLTPVRVAGPQKVRRVATGWAHTCVLTWSGSVECWGYNGNGECGCPTPKKATVGSQCTPYAAGSKVVDIVAGSERTCARLEDGNVQCWGRNGFYEVGNGSDTSALEPSPVLGISGAVGLATGLWQACALTKAGTVWCWGANERAQLGNGSTDSTPIPTAVSGIDGTTRKAAAAAPAEDHTCFLLSDGSVDCVGSNTYGQLGDGTRLFAILPVTCRFGKKATKIATGSRFTCALLEDGQPRCLGGGMWGQLGTGKFESSDSPLLVQLPSGTQVRTLVARYDHACVLSEEGRVWCWGLNGSGQLGNGTKADSSVPVEVPGPL